jgi:dihydrofolate reductase
VLVAGSLEEALALLKREKSVESIFVLGGTPLIVPIIHSDS